MVGSIIQCILQQSSSSSTYVMDWICSTQVFLKYRKTHTDAAKSIHLQCPSELQHTTDAGRKKAYLPGLPLFPLNNMGLSFTRVHAFTDALCLRYG